MPPDIILHKVLAASLDEPGIAPHPSMPARLCGSWVQCQGCRFTGISESIEGFLLTLPVLYWTLQFQQENLICHAFLISVTLLMDLAAWPVTQYFWNCEWHVGDQRAAIRETSALGVVWTLVFLGSSTWEHPTQTVPVHPKVHHFQQGPLLQSVLFTRDTCQANKISAIPAQLID